LTYQRDITSNERLYIAGEQLCPPFAVNMVVEGSGAVELEVLRQAVERAAAACPGARLIAKSGRWVDSGRAPAVRRGDIETALRARFDAERGPTCEVVVAEGAILFRAFHGVMDGKGLLVFVHDVFRALRGETPVGAPSTITDHALVEQLGGGKARKFEFDCPPPFGPVKHESFDFTWKRRTIPGTHAALVARITATLCAERGLRVMVPVDIRRHAPDISSTGNLSMPIFLDVQRGEAWEQLQERLLAALAERAELTRNDMESVSGILPGFGLKAMIRMAATVQRAKGKFLLASAIVSHLGKVPLAGLCAPGFSARTLYSPPSYAPLAPLTVSAVECGAHVELCVAAAAGSEMARQVDALLDRIVAALDTHAWEKNATAAEFPDRTVVELFRAQVARTPHAVALVQDGRDISYRELDRRADGVAAALAARGVGEGSVVGLLVDRSLDGVAALWGVLKSGAAYLPLDPRHPDERLRFMLGDAAVKVCLTEHAHVARLAAIFGGEALCAGDIAATDAPSHGPRSTRALAYVIYTSGSTGKPKGVQIEHRALVNYLHWAIAAYRTDERTRFALFTSLAFDLTVTALFVPLLSGGSVALFPEELDHLSLKRLLVDSGVDALKLTPTHLDLIGRLDLAPAGFRVLVVGGEQLHGSVATRAQRMFGPSCRIINEYGPTETTVGCIYHVFGADDAGASAVPIGVPAYNTRIALLDAGGASVERGESGEIYILGEGLARGYLGRPELDALRFVALPGGRAYRTGDLARIRDDGLMEFLGRADDQIKIRGHRIEPGEVEAVLRRHPAVEQAVVVGRTPPAGGGMVLCAYAVASTSEDALREHLEAQLPPAMVPSFLALVAAVPLTVNGKVDVRSLPAPFVQAGSVAADRPRDALEASVAEIWARLLSVDHAQLGPDADFHRLGGDSLKMVEMLASVARSLGGTSEERFMQCIRPVLRRPTLSNVCKVALSAQQASP
jgi:amino acid adenylation domain-containing protein